MKEWLRIASALIGVALIVWLMIDKFTLQSENADLRAERIATDSLRKVAVNQWEIKVREVQSERELKVQLGLKNDTLAKELGKRDVKIRELTELTIALKADSGRGTVIVDSTKSQYKFTLASDNGLVTVKGLLLTRTLKATGRFTFAPIPPISIVLYEDELKYINARVKVDERYMDLVSFKVQRYEPAAQESWRGFLGAGIQKSFDLPIRFGPFALAGVTWHSWGVSGMVGANSYGLSVIRSF
jgi:hypothetical protein